MITRYSLSDLNRYSKKESDFKSDVSTNFTKRALNFFMAQLDFLIIAPVFCSLSIILIIYYIISIKLLIPSFFGVKKFRKKKLSLLVFVYELRKKLNFSDSYLLMNLKNSRK